MPFPATSQLASARAAYEAEHPRDGCYFTDLVRAHRHVGLARELAWPAGVGPGVQRAWVLVSLCPYKDMEVSVLADALASPAAVALHAVLRGLIDELGARSFNVGVLNLGAADGTGSRAAGVPWEPVWVRVVSRGKLTVQASDFGGLEVFAGASIGHTDPFTVAQALDAAAAKLGLEWVIGAPSVDLVVEN